MWLCVGVGVGVGVVGGTVTCRVSHGAAPTACKLSWCLVPGPPHGRRDRAAAVPTTKGHLRYVVGAVVVAQLVGAVRLSIAARQLG